MSRIRRLLSMGPAEVSERLRQAMAVRVDRAGLGARVKPGPSPESLARGFEVFRNRDERFFAGAADLQATIAALRRLDPEDEARTVRTADAVMDGRLGVFGSEYDVGSPPDWAVEPVCGLRYAAAHWSQIDYMRPEVGGEYKVTWEIARHQYFLDLGRAWLYTGEERYAETFALHVRDFIRANPPGRGIHWSSSLEVAFRAMSWIWALHLFRDARTLTPELYGEVLGSLVIHGRHIACYLSTYFSPNTHLTGESLALFWLGTVFPELEEAGDWRETAWRTLEEQLPIQVRPDGTYHEQSTAYGRYNADFYLHFVILRERLGEPVPAPTRDRLSRALDALLAVTRPDGTAPYLGDDDGGRLLPVDGRGVNDQRAPLGTGALIFERPDFKHMAGPISAETVWLLGPQAVDAYERLPSRAPDPLCASFSDGGLLVQRDGWGRAANMLVATCGPLGTLNCGHAHADLLSIDVTIGGRPVIVDSGTFTYTSEPEERNRLRSGTAHNGLTISGSGSSEPGGPFQWVHTTDGRLLDWREGPGWCWFSGREHFPRGETHDRGVLFVSGSGWIIHDHVRALDAAALELSFHLAPDLETATVQPGRVDIVERSSGRVVATVAWPDESPTVRVDEVSHSPSYRMRSTSQVIRVSAEASGSWSLTTVLGRPENVDALLEQVDRALALGTEVDGGEDGP